VLDLFLQMLGEGRLTEQGSGETADFTQSIIIMTSNAGISGAGQTAGRDDGQRWLVNA